MREYSEIKVSVPGSIMLMGEHAVLFGHRALACAVDKYIHLSLTPRDDRQVHIDSALAQYQSDLDELAPEPKLSFVLAAVRQLRDQLLGGFSLAIKADFSHTVGLGSSAAVTVATVSALRQLVGLSIEKADIFADALNVVHAVQGRGSGTDLAASTYGGLIAYTVAPRQVEALPGLPDISLYYAGYKTRTPDVLQFVAERAESQTTLYQGLYQLMHQTSLAAEQAIHLEDWPELGKLMDIYQGLMDALGVCDASIADMIYRLRSSDQVLGAKISGSGLGDCVIALGQDKELEMPYEQIPVQVSKQGVSFELN